MKKLVIFFYILIIYSCNRNEKFCYECCNVDKQILQTYCDVDKDIALQMSNNWTSTQLLIIDTINYQSIKSVYIEPFYGNGNSNQFHKINLSNKTENKILSDENHIRLNKIEGLDEILLNLTFKVKLNGTNYIVGGYSQDMYVKMITDNNERFIFLTHFPNINSYFMNEVWEYVNLSIYVNISNIANNKEIKFDFISGSHQNIDKNIFRSYNIDSLNISYCYGNEYDVISNYQKNEAIRYVKITNCYKN
jgi:hypothetical protein